MSKKILITIVIIILTAAVAVTFVTVGIRKSALAPANEQEVVSTSTATLSHSFAVGYEGDFTKYTYTIPYNPQKLQVWAIPEQNEVWLRDGATGGRGVLRFFYNGAAGFENAADVFTQLQLCPNCTAQSEKPSVPVATGEVKVFASTADYWVVAAYDTGYVIIGMPTASKELAQNLLNNLKISAAKNNIQPEISEVKIFLSKQGQNDCRVVYPLNRSIIKTPSIASATVRELVRGVRDEEVKQGFVSQVPKNSWVYSIKIADKKAVVNFSKEFDEGGGSCAKQALRAQIEKTLLQFPTITSVEIQVEGRADTALQP